MTTAASNQAIDIINAGEDSGSPSNNEETNEMKFKTSILQYIATLPSMVKLRLYSKSSSSLSVFRLLPSLGKFLVMGLLFQGFDGEDDQDEEEDYDMEEENITK